MKVLKKAHQNIITVIIGTRRHCWIPVSGFNNAHKLVITLFYTNLPKRKNKFSTCNETHSIPKCVLFKNIDLSLSLSSLLRYCIDIAKLLFWVLWACLDMKTKNNSITL